MARREPLPRSAAGDRNPWLIAVVVSIATFMEVLDTTIANVALRHIAGSLGADQDESTWILTSYLVSNAIVLPVSGWLANVLGRKRFYMMCVATFTFASFLCAMSTSLSMILAARVLQGVGGGGMAPAEQSMFADTFPPEKRAQAFALYGLTVVSAPAIGPVLGGWLTDNLSWHWVFLINIPVGLLSLTLVQWLVVEPEVLQQERKERLAKGLDIDLLGLVLVVIGFGALQIMLDRYEQDDGFGSGFITTLAVLSGTALVSLVVWELIHPHPVVNVRLLGYKNFAVSCGLMFLIGFVLISTTQLLPQLTQSLLGYDATTAGMTLGVGGIATLVLMPVSGIVTGRIIQPKWLIGVATVGMGLAMLHAATLNLDINFWTVSTARVIQVIWLPFLFIPISAVSYIGMPPNRNNEASAIFNLMRNLGGSVGVSFVTTMLVERTQFHHARLAEHITAYNGYGWGVPLAPINAIVQTQASVMSYLDVFWVLGLLALVVSPAVLLLPRVPKGAAIGH
ncbi:MAG TPA: DHA2 family efflux MFS transporter permease subunit [Rhodopila sp.]|uniref:DHA2 family efflux MFS transporter permease subunit n=1 Tax=Rhodopila sp. TaxID=2480087 RepID=UPI002C1A79B3|nr:DHA2 family efflux MFS transporter permease subunit [Rhodopila sp.]HVY16403.1 DHA2 family efflux MFS transporter permease subunit [Rhodopila sp.]